MDPRKFKHSKSYAFAQSTAWAKANFVNELLEWIDNKVKEAEYLTEKEQGKLKDKLRDSLS